MIKEAGLFIISAGFLVYFMAPDNQDAEAEAQRVDVTEDDKVVLPAPKKQAVSWDEDEEEDTEEEFVFGEPMTGTDPVSEYDDDESYDDNYVQVDRAAASDYESSSRDEAANVVSISDGQSNDPRPGELGSAANPRPLR